jgi:hypothetical protein
LVLLLQEQPILVVLVEKRKGKWDQGGT